jgi:uncharacterized protein
MTPPPTRRLVLQMLALGLAFPALGSCRKRKDPPGRGVAVMPLAEKFRVNRLHELPGTLYQNQARSPIHWQPWAPEALGVAREAGRMVFLVIAMPQQPAFQRVLESLASDPLTVEEINTNYVPVLVDGDAAREMGLLTADLCDEIKSPLQLPLFVWLSHEGNPVDWIPAPDGDPAMVRRLFESSHSVVMLKWREDPAYLLENSRIDHANRREHIAKRRNAEFASDDPGDAALQATRKLAGLYDPVSRTLDESGGLFPAGSLELLSMAAMLPGVPEQLRVQAVATTRELLADLLPSPMFDPLDGGVFASRRGISWKLPVFTKDCAMQGRAAVALISAYHATGDALALERALTVIRHAELSYRVADGLFAIGLGPVTAEEDWLWSVEDVRNALPAADAEWWIGMSGMAGLGNIPFEDDPERRFFRANAIAIPRSVAALAAESGNPQEFLQRFETTRNTLLLARQKRFGDPPRDGTPHAGASLRMVSAYAAAHAATGEADFREKAVDLLTRARSAFADGPRLLACPGKAPASVSAGRAFVYALALQAALDVADITADPLWASWADDLAATSAELFTTDGYLKECPDDARILDLPVTDLAMLFDDSSAGLFSMAECRLAARGQPMTRDFRALALALPKFAGTWPMRFTDLILPNLIRHFGSVAVTGPDLDPALQSALQRTPLRVVGRRLSAAAASIEKSDGGNFAFDSVERLEEASLHVSPDR